MVDDRRRWWRWGRVLVAGPSMLPTMRPGDQLLVRWGAPARPGDVVVVRPPGRSDLLTIKRVRRRESDGRWWVEGDHGVASTDSRQYGALLPDAVLGRVVCRYWPVPRRRS